MNDDIENIADIKMKKYTDAFEIFAKKMRMHRISLDILQSIKVKRYETVVPIQKLSKISIENYKTAKLDVFDRSSVMSIEKAILESEFGFNVYSTKNKIFVSLPEITTEQKNKIAKIINKEGEKVKILIRNVRRDINTKIKIKLKNKIISKDEEHLIQRAIQNKTNVYIDKINKIILNKFK